MLYNLGSKFGGATFRVKKKVTMGSGRTGRQWQPKILRNRKNSGEAFPKRFPKPNDAGDDVYYGDFYGGVTVVFQF